MASKAKNNSSNAKVYLEDYLLLLHSRSHLNLTVTHLNQIIHMHGFKKIHKVHKKLLSDAVNSLDLVNPCRSTLHDYISPLVTVKTEDVMADLSDLNWQECHITSIETLSRSWNNVNQYQSLPPRNDAVKFQQYSPPPAPDSVAHSVVVKAPFPAKRRSARKRRRTAKVADLVNISFP
uniref:uncharacterized protein LOC101297471 n=1 Tax=Fragaria vesca subsp. vesca TaxID=101020 RepID=UPI0005CB1B27|nr:PREDICTED: uncharacterized protein LOC101297471 [Fragaria vesca subsp. vesca]